MCDKVTEQICARNLYFKVKVKWNVPTRDQNVASASAHSRTEARQNRFSKDIGSGKPVAQRLEGLGAQLPQKLTKTFEQARRAKYLSFYLLPQKKSWRYR
jgi:hypothetical protein